MTRPAVAAILSFTEMEKERHRAFNQWHRFEHQPDEFTIEGVVAAERLVAPPDLMDKRVVQDKDLAPAQYFGFYLVSQPIHKAFNEIEALGRVVRATNKSFVRKGPSAGYRVARMYSAPGVMNPPQVMPYRSHQGVFVTVDDPKPGASVQDLERDHAANEKKRVQELLGLRGVAGCWSFQAARLVKITSQDQALARRTIRIFWLDNDPATFTEAAEDLSVWESRDGSNAYTNVFRGGFRTIPATSSFDWFD